MVWEWLASTVGLQMGEFIQFYYGEKGGTKQEQRIGGIKRIKKTDSRLGLSVWLRGMAGVVDEDELDVVLWAEDVFEEDCPALGRDGCVEARFG